MFSVRAKNRLTDRFPSSRRRRRGVTRLELLLVLSVILLAIEILLPSVQLARERARREQCKRNLKQLGLAVSNYVDVYKCYPAGFDVSPNGNYLGWGWNLKILPYMDAADLYNQLEPQLAEGIHGLPENSQLNRRMTSFLCPSDTRTETVPHARVVTEKVVDGIVSAGTEDWHRRFPRSSYFGNVGYLQVEAGGILPNAAGIPTSLVPLSNAGSLGHFGTTHSPDRRYCDHQQFGGVFGQNSHVAYRDMTDGTSNTFMIGERYSPADLSVTAVGYGTWIGVPDCTRAQGLAMALADTSMRINIGMPLRESTTGFGSLHHEGAFFVLGDGSARFVSQKINLLIFRGLSVIDDGSRPWLTDP